MAYHISKPIPSLPEQHLIAIPVFITDRLLNRHLVPTPAASRELMDCLIYVADHGSPIRGQPGSIIRTAAIFVNKVLNTNFMRQFR
jgi:hypothetical protein